MPLGGGAFALVDAADFDRISAHVWSSTSIKGRKPYARRNVVNDGRLRHVLMHREILEAPEGTQVDHRSRDTLDNRRQNLRFATEAENHRNVGPRKGALFKGVKKTPSGRWAAEMRDGEKHVWLGSFSSAEDAARAYDRAAREKYGEFAWLNFGKEPAA